ncbi:MAG: type II secretion system GspH family protein [Turicibacter sp.]|nr:type II secretion system GspH family protein [Turicibacter sp.]
MKNVLNNKTKNPGLTLIEVIISVALLAILSLPVLTVINSNIKLSQKTEMAQHATGTGQRIIEYLNMSDTLSLDSNTALSEIGLNIVFDESTNADGNKVFSGLTELEDGSVVDIQLTEVMSNETSSNGTMTTNQFMQNPDFTISVSDGDSLVVSAKEDLEVFPFNPSFTASHLTLEIDKDQYAHLCQLDKETGTKGSCVSARLEGIKEQIEPLSGIKMVVNGELSRKYEIPVINEGANAVKIYVQTDTVSGTNQFKFDREVDEMHVHKGVTISYLTKLPTSSTLSNLNNLYEIDVKITNSKVSGTLFEGQSMTNLKIENKKGGN